MTNKCIEMACLSLIFLLGLSGCNTFPAPTERPPTIPPEPTVAIGPTSVAWQNAGWYPIAPPGSFFDAANNNDTGYAHEGYPEWASRNVYTFHIKPDNSEAIICSVSAKNTSGLNASGQTYPQPGGDAWFKQFCSNIPLTQVGELPSGNVYSFPGGPQEGLGYILVPKSEASQGNIYVSIISEDTEGYRIGKFTGELVYDPVLIIPYTGNGRLEICTSLPGVWGGTILPTTDAP